MPDEPRPWPPISLRDMIDEVKRECQMRRWLYSTRVSDGRMNRRQADRKIDVMDAILRHLEAEHAQDRGHTG